MKARSETSARGYDYVEYRRRQMWEWCGGPEEAPRPGAAASPAGFRERPRTALGAWRTKEPSAFTLTIANGTRKAHIQNLAKAVDARTQRPYPIDFRPMFPLSTSHDTIPAWT